jgi:solute carrier family 50 protein (sugar transporter)
MYLGYVGIVVDVWMFASPLGTLKRVIRTKSAASIPINLSLMLFASTSLWVVSGLVGSDYFVAGLNAIGSLLSIVQMVFYRIYRPKEAMLDQGEEDAGEVSVVTPISKTTREAARVQSPVFELLSSPPVHRAG